MAAGIHIENTDRERLATGEELAVRLWRFGQLIARGFAPNDAQTLACDPRVDLAVARSLVSRGCPPALAVRILT